MALISKKKKKSKGTKGKKDSWTLEGGVKFAPADKGVDEKGKRKPRATQEKDEKLRRGILKMTDNARKRAFAKKMSHKVQLKDYLSNTTVDQAESEDSAGVNSETELPAKRQRGTSSLSVLQRLHVFANSDGAGKRQSVNHAVARGQSTDELIARFLGNDADQDEEDEEGDGEEGDEGGDEQDDEMYDEEEEEEEEEADDCEDPDGDDEEEEEENDEKEEGDNIHSLDEAAGDNSVYNWMFNVDAAAANSGKVSSASRSTPSKTTSSHSVSSQIHMLKQSYKVVGDFNAPITSEHTLHQMLEPTKTSDDMVLSNSFDQQTPPAVAIQALSKLLGGSVPKLWASISQSGVPPTRPAITDTKKVNKKMAVPGEAPTLPEAFYAATTQTLLPILATYTDVLVDGRTYQNDPALLAATLTHACIHALKARSSVIKHNERLKQKHSLDKQLKHGAKGKNKARNGKDKSWISKDNQNDDIEASESDEENMQNEVINEDISNKHSHVPTNTTSQETGTVRDQGFVRPRILIICPFRGVALRVIENIRDIFGSNTTLGKEEKLYEEFGSPDFSSSSSDEDDVSMDNDNEEKSGKTSKKKKVIRPKDWRSDFHQNVDDDFKIGIQINPGKGKGNGASKGVFLRLFSDFYISDIIVASPLGLRFILENPSKRSDGDDNDDDDGENDAASSKKKLAAADFLSSMEMVIAHQADVMYMQNWDHLNFIFSHLNKMPAENHDTDFSRVRSYFLEGKGAQHRQLIMTTQFQEPTINNTFRRFAQSMAGNVRLKRLQKGILADVKTDLKQVFQKVPLLKLENSMSTSATVDLVDAEESRWNYFKEHILMPILRTGQTRTLLIAPSYVHYVRIRNELLKLQANAAFVCEYSRDSEISRGRSRFFHGRHDILLYSGRCHFFRRFAIRGAQHVVFYSIPEYPHFYAELVNTLSSQEDVLNIKKQRSLGVGGSSSTPSDNTQGEAKRVASGDSSSLVLFNRLDKLALERLIGDKRAKHILHSEKGTFMFQ